MSRENFQIDTYLEQQELKQHQLDMLGLLDKNVSNVAHILDLGCANGLFSCAMKQHYASARVTGVEVSPEMIAEARQNFKNINDAEVIESTIEEFEPSVKYDVIVASGVLSLFDEPFEQLSRWMNWLSSTGVLIVFGRFNTHPVDTRVQYRNHFNDNGWESGLTSYSIHSYQQFFADKDCSAEFIKFELPFDRQPSENPTNTWTVQTSSGERLIINGANTVAEFHHLVIKATG